MKLILKKGNEKKNRSRYFTTIFKLLCVEALVSDDEERLFETVTIGRSKFPIITPSLSLRFSLTSVYPFYPVEK